LVDFSSIIKENGSDALVEVNLNTEMLSLASKFVQEGEKEVGDIIKGLKQIKINVISLKEENRDQVVAGINDLRTSLDSKGWSRIVSVKEKKEDVAIFLKTRKDEAVEGLCLTVLSENKEAVLINIVGEIRPDQVSKVATKLGLDPLKELTKAMGQKQAAAETPKETQ
jgi:hypothetical protein